MSEFVEVKASKSSLSKRKLVHGIGVNDAWYVVTRVVDGQNTKCPFYGRWLAMIVRCYSSRYHKNKPTYKDCTVCNEWLTFSNFKSWMIKQDWKGKHLDKDLIKQGNKVYSPELCLFVTGSINSFLLDKKLGRGAHPQGVHFHAPTGKYIASVSIDGKRRHIGLLATPELAFESYKAAKYAIIKDMALKQSEPLKSALLNYVINP